MSYYAFIYAISIVLSIGCGILVLKRYWNLSGFFFFLFTVFWSAWFLFYFLFFSGIDNVQTLLFLSRLDFWVSLGANYSLLLFVFFFGTKSSGVSVRTIYTILLGYLLILSLHIFTPCIISWLAYSIWDQVYREVFGVLYIVNPLLHILWVSLLLYFATQQLKKQAYLNRIRLKRILFWALLPLSAAIILQLILPAFGIWILEKEIIFFYLAFVVYVFYVLKRYYFSSLGYGIGKIFIAYLSIILSIVSLNFIKSLYFYFKTGPINNYWMFQDQYSVIDTIIGIMVFYFSYKHLYKIFLWNHLVAELKNKIQKLEQGISYINNLRDLNAYLWTEIRKIFKTPYCEIRIFPKNKEKTELQKYFESNLSDKIFINDVVFIEERKTKFNKKHLFHEIPKEAFLILPLFGNTGEKNTGVLIIGAKSFGDFYTIEEIEILRGIMPLLKLHLKYIETYEQIQDLSVNLDKKVDEKTMEYNDLINRQKEFISIISHEIKTPITTAIFQADSIIDDLEKETISREEIGNELKWLSAQLIKTGELLSKIFSVQYFDTHHVALFREKVKISYLLETEYDIYSRMHEYIRFINRIDSKMWFVEIDKIQFQQVIANILNNAVKFANPKDPIIIIEAERKGEWLHISIEDNGKWFEWINMERLFEKYSIGHSGSAGLWMGLYLCKKIIDMHGGEITASISENLSWAKFTIKIPVH